MGWGICFALDETSGRVYCADGCKWRASKADYDDYPVWPSAHQSVLDYFEGDAHRELDMVRDEFPGTANGLAAACDEHIGMALQEYYSLSDEEKTMLHEQKMKELEEELSRLKLEIPRAMEAYKEYKKRWIDYQKNPPKMRKSKTRADEIRQLMAPLELELELEEAAKMCDMYKKEKARVTRLLKLESKFKI